jgi:O-antigen/teichoic acid export membrane protein
MPDGPARYARAGTVLAALYLSAALGLGLIAPDLVDLVAPRAFGAARWVVPSVAVGCALKEIGEYFRNGLLVGGDPRALAWFEPAVAVLDAVLGWLIVRRWGFWGALAVGPLVFALYALGLHAAARRVLPVRYEYRRLAALCAVALGIGALGAAAHTGARWSDAALRLGLALTMPAGLLVAGARSDEGRALIDALRRRARGW